jgi:hypothetical protein
MLRKEKSQASQRFQSGGADRHHDFVLSRMQSVYGA